MATLRDIRRRIKSVKNTQQITKAMKMVAAAKLRRAQEDITAARPYTEKMLEVITRLAQKTAQDRQPMPSVEDTSSARAYAEAVLKTVSRIAKKRMPGSHPLLAVRDVRNIELIIMASDRGLCGGFNSNIIREAERFLESISDGVDVSLNIIGRRAMEHFKRRGVPIRQEQPFGSGRPEYDFASRISKEIMDRYIDGAVDEVQVIYTEFRSALSQQPVRQKLLPIVLEKGDEERVEMEEEPDECIYEPSKDAILHYTLPKNIETQFFRALLDSAASEHGARMTAMDSASNNAKEMIGSLTLQYNRARQAAITKELTEIVSGAEALKG